MPSSLCAAMYGASGEWWKNEYPPTVFFFLLKPDIMGPYGFLCIFAGTTEYIEAFVVISPRQ